MAILETPIENILYDSETKQFSIFSPEESSEKWILKLSIQDLADCISIAHKAKVTKDNEIKKQYT